MVEPLPSLQAPTFQLGRDGDWEAGEVLNRVIVEVKNESSTIVPIPRIDKGMVGLFELVQDIGPIFALGTPVSRPRISGVQVPRCWSI